MNTPTPPALDAATVEACAKVAAGHIAFGETSGIDYHNRVVGSIVKAIRALPTAQPAAEPVDGAWLDELEALLAKARPGPWKAFHLLRGNYEVCQHDNYATGGICVPHRASDAAAIVALHNAAPRLIAAARTRPAPQVAVTVTAEDAALIGHWSARLKSPDIAADWPHVSIHAAELDRLLKIAALATPAPIDALTAERDALREALTLAADRLAILSGSVANRQHQLIAGEWSRETRAALTPRDGAALQPEAATHTDGSAR